VEFKNSLSFPSSLRTKQGDCHVAVSATRQPKFTSIEHFGGGRSSSRTAGGDDERPFSAGIVSRGMKPPYFFAWQMLGSLELETGLSR
jgi:hypothetical protein